MTRTSDRTLIARMGFADSDRSSPDHDLGCMYLAQGTQLRKLAEYLYSKDCTLSVWPTRIRGTSLTDVTVLGAKITPYRAELEKLIGRKVYSGGSDTGRRSGLVGFADVFFTVDCEVRYTDQNGRNIAESLPRLSVLVEVKSRPVPASAILRQIRVYEEHLRPDRGDKLASVAAVMFDMPRRDVVLLRNQGVEVIRLGDPFRRWVEEQKTRVDDGKPVEEF